MPRIRAETDSAHPKRVILSHGVGARLRALASRPLASRATTGTAAFNLVIAAIGSTSGLVIARGLGPAGRGNLAAVIAWTAVLGLVGSLGLTQATTFFVARSPTTREVTVGTTSALLLGLGTIVGLLGVFVSQFIGHSREAILCFRIAFLATPVVFVGGAWASALQATSPKLWNFTRVVQPVGYIVGTLGLLVTRHMTLVTATVTLVGSSVGQALVAAFLLTRHVAPRPRVDQALIPELLRYGVRSTASDAPWIVNARLDQLLLSVTVSSAALGYYAVAVSVSLLAVPIASAFGSTAFPRIARATTVAEALAVQRSAVKGSILASCAVLAPVAVTAPFLVPLILGARFTPSVVVLELLAPGTVAFVTNKVMADVLLGRGQPLETAKAEGVGAVVTVVTLPLLVSRMGINGAAIASVLAYSTSSLLLWRALRLPYRLVA